MWWIIGAILFVMFVGVRLWDEYKCANSSYEKPKAPPKPEWNKFTLNSLPTVVETFPSVKDVFGESTLGTYNKKLCQSAPKVKTVVHEVSEWWVILGYLTDDNKYVEFSKYGEELIRKVWNIRHPIIRVAEDLLANQGEWVISAEKNNVILFSKNGVELRAKINYFSNCWGEGELTVGNENIPVSDEELLLIKRISFKIREELDQTESREKENRDKDYRLGIDTKIAKMFNKEK